MITSRNYLSEWNVTGTKNGRTNGPEERDSEWWTTSSKYAGLGAAMAAAGLALELS